MGRRHLVATVLVGTFVLILLFRKVLEALPGVDHSIYPEAVIEGTPRSEVPKSFMSGDTYKTRHYSQAVFFRSFAAKPTESQTVDKLEPWCAKWGVMTTTMIGVTEAV